MDIKKIAGALGIGAIVVATGGLATPLVGIVGLSSAVVGGMSAVTTVGVVRNASDAKKSKKENKGLREELRKSNLDNAAKQKVIEKLYRRIEEIKQELTKEKAKYQKNNEKIKFMQEQIDDLMETIRAAQAA